MQLYLDTSALVKIVAAEPESRSLRSYPSDHRTDTRFASALVRTELIRATARHGSLEIGAHARRVLATLDTVALTNRMLDVAAGLPRSVPRTLDAIHLAAALTAPDLRALVTHDERLARAATDSGITVVTPR